MTLDDLRRLSERPAHQIEASDAEVGSILALLPFLLDVVEAAENTVAGVGGQSLVVALHKLGRALEGGTT